jgi:tetratricopeptide (TPR) repeat protein
MEEDLSGILGQESASQGAQAASSEELIPDWMKDAGWMPASGDTSAAEQGYTFEDLEEGEKLEPAEIPSWLKAIAPKQLPVEGEIDQGELGEVDSKLIEALDSAALPWLQETPPGPSDTVASWLEGIEPAAPEAAPAEGLPEWLIGAGLAAGAAVAAGKGDEIEEVAEEPAQTLEPAEPIALAEGEITFAAGEELIPQVESTTEEEVPDWLKELSAAEEPVGEISAEVESELPEWLASAPQEQEIEPLLSEGKPDLLSGLQPAIEEAGEPLVEEGMEWLSAAPAGEVAEQVSAEELPDWLRELKPEEIKREEQPQESEEEIPEWLVGLAAGAGAAVLAGELHGEEPVEMPGETVEAEPTGMEEALAPQAEISQEDEEAAYAWLEGLAAKQGASEALFLSPEERLEEPPEWIQQEATQFDEAVAVEPVLAEQEAELQELPGVEEAELAEIAAIESEWIPEDFAAEEALQAALDEALREGLEAPDLAEVSPEEFLPTWLRKAGPESAVSQVEEGASPEAVDITSWLSQMEESEAESIESGAEPWQVDAESVAEQAVMDWLPAIEPTGEIHEEDAALAEWLSQQPQVAGEEEFEFPQTDQWLEKALEEDLTGQLLAAESSEEPKPAWLVDFEESEETVAGITTPCEIGEEEGLPEWMVGTAALAGAAALAAAGGEEKSAEEQLPEEEAGFPTWLEEVETGAEGVLEIEEPEIIAGDTQPVGAVQIAETLPTPEAVVEEAIEIQGAPLSEVAAEEAEPEAISDEDAAFAWLESLAVRQGATEALLLTPEERLEEPPEWVQKESLEEEEVPLAETQPAVSQLESEMEPQVEPATEMEEELPEWLIGAAAGAAVAAGAYLAEEKEEPAEQLPEAEVAGVVPEAETASEEAPAVEGEIEAAYAWLESLAELQETGDGEAEIPAAVVEEEAPELPEWLADLEPVAEETAEAETIWTPEMAGIATQAETEPLESLVAPLDLNQAALIQIERLPGVGFRRAQALIEYRQVHGPLNSLDDLARVESFDRELIDSLVSYAVVSAPVAPELTPVEAVAESQPPVMERAQIEQGDVTTLLDNYQDLIHRQENLPQVVTGLQDALELRPQDTSLWMALGDAQMRLGQVKEALEAYSKAEELLV